MIDNKIKEKKLKIWLDGSIFFKNYSGELYSAEGILIVLRKYFDVGIFLPKDIYETGWFIKKFKFKKNDIFISQFNFKLSLVFRFFGFNLGLPKITSQDLIFIPNHRVFASIDNQICLIHDVLPITQRRHVSLFDQLFFIISIKRIIRLKLVTFCHSKEVKKELQKLCSLPKKQISILPLGLNLNSIPSFKKFYNNEGADKVWKLLFISAYHPRKNFELLIQYIKKIRESTDLKIELILAGKGLREKFYYENNNFITIHDYINEKSKWKLFVECDIYVNPSAGEGFGITNLEAQFFSLPIICNDIPIFHEILSKYAYFFNVYEFNSFKNALFRLIKNKSYRGEITFKASCKVKTKNYFANIEKFFIPKIKFFFNRNIKKQQKNA